MSIEDEINEIESYIRTLDTNDNINKIDAEMIKEGTEKGLIFDFCNDKYRGTIFSTKVIKQEEYNEFQKYIDKCEKEQYENYLKWKQGIIDSGVDFSKDELKYHKMI
jgi:hypothetical protein